MGFNGDYRSLINQKTGMLVDVSGYTLWEIDSWTLKITNS